jgi:hypothetical protein
MEKEGKLYLVEISALLTYPVFLYSLFLNDEENVQMFSSEKNQVSLKIQVDLARVKHLK